MNTPNTDRSHAPNTDKPLQASALALLTAQSEAYAAAISQMRGIDASSPLMQQLIELSRTIALIRIADVLERIDEGMAMHIEESLSTIATAVESIEGRFEGRR